jgi:hypothetical protein
MILPVCALLKEAHFMSWLRLECSQICGLVGLFFPFLSVCCPGCVKASYLKVFELTLAQIFGSIYQVLLSHTSDILASLEVEGQ